jgi:arylsulfatase
MRRPWLATLALSAVLGAACAPPPVATSDGRGLLVIAIDALRADHLSCLGYDRATTPVFDELAAQGTLFTDTWSAAPEVLAANTAILTGCDPLLARRPGAVASGPSSELAAWSWPAGLPSLAQELLARGYETAAFVDHPALAPIRGVARGFQVFQGFREDAVDPELELGMEGVATKFLRWLDGVGPGADWFAYLHVNDLERQWSRRAFDPRWDTLFEPRPELAHVPPVSEAEHAYFALPRPRWAGGSQSLGEYEAHYDAELRQLNMKLWRVLQRLQRSGRLRSTTVVVVGTYGVSFGEGGLYLDSGELSASDLSVPWIVRPAPTLGLPRGREVGGVASLIDLAPTLLELEGLAVPAAMQGISQRAALIEGPRTTRELAFAAGGFHRGWAVIDGRWMLRQRDVANALTPLLAQTWLGRPAQAEAGPLLELVERAGSEGGAGAEARARLEPELTRWHGWIERARPLLHGRARRESDAELADELRRRGLLAR